MLYLRVLKYLAFTLVLDIVEPSTLTESLSQLCH